MAMQKICPYLFCIMLFGQPSQNGGFYQSSSGQFFQRTNDYAPYRFEDFIGSHEENAKPFQSHINIYKQHANNGFKTLYSIFPKDIQNHIIDKYAGEFNFLDVNPIRHSWYFSWIDLSMPSSNVDIDLFECTIERKEIHYLGNFGGSNLSVIVSPSGSYLLIYSNQHSNVNCCLDIEVLDIKHKKFAYVYQQERSGSSDLAMNAEWGPNDTIKLDQLESIGEQEVKRIHFKDFKINTDSIQWMSLPQ